MRRGRTNRPCRCHCILQVCRREDGDFSHVGLDAGTSSKDSHLVLVVLPDILHVELCPALADASSRTPFHTVLEDPPAGLHPAPETRILDFRDLHDRAWERVGRTVCVPLEFAASPAEPAHVIVCSPVLSASSGRYLTCSWCNGEVKKLDKAR